jgi:hypothetical protein
MGLQGVQVEELLSVLQWLPDSASVLPQYPALEEQLHAQVVSLFQDVHGLLTDCDQLQHFRKLPFQALCAWADSDELIVDSENSVAVAISWWYGGEQGSGSSNEQLEELSGLLRVTHLTLGRCAG